MPGPQLQRLNLHSEALVFKAEEFPYVAQTFKVEAMPATRRVFVRDTPPIPERPSQLTLPGDALVFRSSGKCRN